MTASCGQIGHYRIPVLVGFYHEVHSDMQRDADGAMCHVLSHMAMELLLKVQTDEIRELKPVAPYREVKRAKRWNVRGGRVQGQRLDLDKSGDRLEKKQREADAALSSHITQAPERVASESPSI